MTSLTFTDADTRSAYSRLLNAQIATQVCDQTRTRAQAAATLARYHADAANAIASLRRYPLSRTTHRPTMRAFGF